MTESIKFIEEVLQGFWPKWDFTDAQTEGWVNRLRRYDYAKAKKCIENYAFDRVKQGQPPNGAIIAVMQKAVVVGDAAEIDPMPLYVIMRPDGRRAGYLTASAKPVYDSNAVVAEAQGLVKQLDREGHRRLYIQFLCPDIMRE